MENSVRIQYGTFEYLILLFGLTNVPMTFQRHINWILKEELNQEKVAYMDNILITGKIKEEHRAKIRRVWTTLIKAGLRAKKSKCKFEKKEVTFLGYRIEREEIRLIKEKL